MKNVIVNTKDYIVENIDTVCTIGIGVISTAASVALAIYQLRLFNRLDKRTERWAMDRYGHDVA